MFIVHRGKEKQTKSCNTKLLFLSNVSLRSTNSLLFGTLSNKKTTKTYPKKRKEEICVKL